MNIAFVYASQPGYIELNYIDIQVIDTSQLKTAELRQRLELAEKDSWVYVDMDEDAYYDEWETAVENSPDFPCHIDKALLIQSDEPEEDGEDLDSDGFGSWG